MNNPYSGDANPFKAIMSFENLVSAIEQLETDGIMTFDEFEKMPYYEIKKRFYALPHPSSIEKAKIKIRSKKDGKEGLSEYTTTSVNYLSNGNVEIVERTHRF